MMHLVSVVNVMKMTVLVVVVNVVKMTGLWFCKSGENDGIYCFGQCREKDGFSGCGQYGK